MKRSVLAVDEAVAHNQASWDEFCRLHGWFWHSTLWREYMLRYRPEAHSRSLAFGIRAADRLVAVVPVMVESSSDIGGHHQELSSGGGPFWAPAIDRTLGGSDRALVMDFAFDEIACRARACGAVRATMQLSPLVPRFESIANEFVSCSHRFGYLDRSINTRIIDLTRPDSELLAAMTHGHRQSIAKAQRLMRIWTGTSSQDFDVYRNLHRLAAGRDTRPAQTFELMRSWLALGHALVAVAEIGGRPAGAILVLVFGDGAYYASAANDPACRKQPIGHGLQWAAVLALRALGVRRYETGADHGLPVPHDVPTDKERSIGRFKASFGGAEIPLYARERFFSDGFARQVMSSRLDWYLEAMKSSPNADVVH